MADKGGFDFHKRVLSSLPSADFSLDDSDSENNEVPVLAAKPLMDHSSVVSHFSDAQEEDVTDVTFIPQPIELAACTAVETEEKKKENDDWQLFKEKFEQDTFKEPESNVSTDFLSSTVVRQLRQELIADLMLSFHDAQFGSGSTPAVGDPMQLVERTSPADPTLSFDKLDMVEEGIDHLLKECESNEMFKENHSATACSTPPVYETYSSDKASDDLMQELVAHHIQNIRKSEVSTTAVVKVTKRLESENALSDVFTASTEGGDKTPVKYLDLREDLADVTPPATINLSQGEKPPANAVKARQMVLDRFAPHRTSESSEEEVREKGDPCEWQIVSRHKPAKPKETESHSRKQSSAVTGSKAPVTLPVSMPVPRKHRKKSKGKGKKSLPGIESAVDGNPDFSFISQSPALKSRRQRRKHTDSLSSDEGLSGNVGSSAVKDDKISDSLAKMITRNLKGLDLHRSENSRPLSSAPAMDVQKPKLSRLPSFTPTEIGPDEDPVFYRHSSLSEAEKEDRVKEYLLRQIEGRKPLNSFLSTPTLFHPEESFGSVLPALSLSLPGPSSTLVIQLTPEGLVQLPVPVSMEIHELLHSALLVWLAGRAAETPTGASAQSMASCSRTEKEYNRMLSEIEIESIVIGDVGIPPVSQVDFKVNGMLQTTQCGKPTILCGIVAAEGNSSMTSQLGEMTFKVLFETLGLTKELEQVSQCLVSNEVLSQPFLSFLVLSDDVESFNQHVSFHCFTAYDSTASCPCVDSSRPLQFTAVSLPFSSFKRYDFTFAFFMRISQEGYGIAGLRLLYNEKCDAILALALRRRNAVLMWMDVAGPDDPVLAAVTDPLSISATYGQHGQELFAYVRTPGKAMALLAKWFGGRCNLKSRTIAGITDPETKSARRRLQKVRFSLSDEPTEDNSYSPEASSPLPSPIYCLALFPITKVVVAVSPSVPASAYSCIFREILEVGYQMVGIQFIRLNQKRAQALGISLDEIQHYTPRSCKLSGATLSVSPTSPNSPTIVGNIPPRPSLLLIVQKEWGTRHAPALVAAIRRSLERKAIPGYSTADIHCTPYPDNFQTLFGLAQLSPTKPVFNLPSLVDLQCSETNRHDPELVFIGVAGEGILDFMPQVLDFIMESTATEVLPSFELLGMKCVLPLSRYQAKLLMQHCHSKHIVTVDALTDVSAFVIALRAVQGHLILNTRIKDLFEMTGSAEEFKKTAVLYSCSSLSAFSILCLFFNDRDLFSDPLKYPLTTFLPPATVLGHLGILEGYTRTLPNLISLFAVDVTQHDLFLKILQKVANSSFAIVGLKISQLKSRNSSNSKFFVVAVQRSNAVWYLEQELKSFRQSSHVYGERIYWSCSYSQSVEDVSWNFPKGLCSKPSQLLFMPDDYKLVCPCMDEPIHVPSDKEYNSGLETTCVFIKYKEGEIAPLLDALEALHSHSFQIFDARLLSFSEAKAAAVQEILNHTIKGKYVVFVVQHLNAATCFSSILKSKSSSSTALANCIVPLSLAEASAILSVLK